MLFSLTSSLDLVDVPLSLPVSETFTVELKYTKIWYQLHLLISLWEVIKYIFSCINIDLSLIHI